METGLFGRMTNALPCAGCQETLTTPPLMAPITRSWEAVTMSW